MPGVARALSELNNAQKTSVRQKDLVSRGAVSDAEVDDSTNQVRVAQARLREAKAPIVPRQTRFGKDANCCAL